MSIVIKRLDPTMYGDLGLPNEAFPLCGRMLPAYDGKWSYTVEMFAREDVTEMVFPDEHYDGPALAENSVFVGAYTPEGACVGLAIYQHSWNRYLYLYDLKVSGTYRRCGIGKRLIAEGRKIAAEGGYRGIYTQGQDNNVLACLFYVSAGFQIGGLDTMLYRGTKQEGKSDILFYLDC